VYILCVGCVKTSEPGEIDKVRLPERGEFVSVSEAVSELVTDP
jgi:hypothetical protein